MALTLDAVQIHVLATNCRTATSQHADPNMAKIRRDCTFSSDPVVDELNWAQLGHQPMTVSDPPKLIASVLGPTS